MLVDTNVGSDKLKINLDITLKRLPCSIVSLDSQDVMGTHSLNIHGRLVKKKLDRNGIVIGELIENKLAHKTKGEHTHDDEDMPNYEDVKTAVREQEGCQLIGNIEVLRVPGNFHVSSHAFGNIIGRLAAEGFYKFDISHTVNHISFGDESDLKHIKNNFNVGILNPIDGVSKTHSDNKIYEYYLKVVPTSYTDVSGKTYNAHQFTSNSNEVTANMMVPTIFFRYDISPILVKVVQYKQNVFHFFIQICAIVGGMFTVMGILDNLLDKLTRSNPKNE
jgi:hypothetical protein